MSFSRALVSRCLWFLALFAVLIPASEIAGNDARQFPVQQNLTYRIEWHLVNAGTANVEYRRAGGDSWKVNVDIESAGLVSRLYHVTDKYTVQSNGDLCPAEATLDAREGNKHTVTRLTFDQAHRTVEYHEHDDAKNTNRDDKITTPADCTREISGALAAVSQVGLEPGKSAVFPVTNGKKAVMARIQSQGRETLSIDGKSYNTIRYEAFLFDNVLYRHRGRLFLWISDDRDRVPVQIRFEIGFPIGNILLQLEKQQKF